VKLGLIVRNSGPEAARGVREIPARAATGGFSSVWVSDHVVVPPSFAERYDAEWCEALASLAFILARTEMHVGISALVLPYRPAWLVTHALRTLPHERITIACGSGWLREEFEALDLPFEDRASITDATIDLLQRDVPNVRLLAAGNRPVHLSRATRCGGWHPIARAPAEIASAAFTGHIALRARFDFRDAPHDRPLYGPPEKIKSDLAAYAAAGVDELVLDFAVRGVDDMLAQIDRFTTEVLS